MAAYVFMCIVEITDLAVYEHYSRRARASIERYGGHILLAGGATDVAEGNWHPRFPILIEFPDRQQAHQWYESDDYEFLKIFGQSGMKFNTMIMEGLVRNFAAGLQVVK